MLKTTLDHLPDDKQNNIRAIVDLIHDEFDLTVRAATKESRKSSRIVLIILFGSYAKGTYVEDAPNGYVSDYDILILLNSPELVDDYRIWHTVEERASLKTGAPVNLIVHTLREVNQELKQGHFFFKDIREQGVQLYQYNHAELLTPGRLVREEEFSVARMHFDRWYTSANEFLEFAQIAIKKSYNKKAAFELHQAVERYFSCLLLVFTNYRPKSHNVKMLNSLVAQLPVNDPGQLQSIFPQDSRFNRRCSQLLKKAYIEARYSDHYEITGEELQWLEDRVIKLQSVTKILCREKINSYRVPS